MAVFFKTEVAICFFTSHPKGKPASCARASKLVMFKQPLLSARLAHLGVMHAVHVTDLIKWEISKISYIGHTHKIYILHQQY